MLSLRGVTRRFGPRAALDGVTLSLAPGTLTALVGPNGAGKTTLLRVAATLDAPTAGEVRVGGVDPREDGAAARRLLAWLGQEPGLYEDLTVRENLAFAAAFFGRAGEVDSAAEAFGVARRLDDRARGLSRGERQRAALARALLGGPLMLLDEPTAALDAEGADAAARALAGLAGARTLLVATHDAELVKRADRVVRLERGRLVEGAS